MRFGRESFASELVNHIQEFDGAPVDGRVELEIHGP
jgi:hypothetical protein